MTQEEAQKEIDTIFDGLPEKISVVYSELKDKIKFFNTFDLISFISYYNHLSDSEEYKDYQEGRHFFVPETLSLLALKSEFVNKTTIPIQEYSAKLLEIQELVQKYCGLKTMDLHKSKTLNADVFSNIANLLETESSSIRNPGLPDHHLIFTEKLFSPFQDEIKKIFGFSISESVILRKEIQKLINHKCKDAQKIVQAKTSELINDIIKFKNKRSFISSIFSRDQQVKYSKLKPQELKKTFQSHFSHEMSYSFKNTYTFSAEELSQWSNIGLLSVQSFLKVFSCNFPSLSDDSEIFEPISLLKKKPILHHDGKYLLPSFPLIIWAVEDIIENEIKKNKKLLLKYNIAKHDFLLNESLNYFKILLPTANILPPNLFYKTNNIQYETDAIIIYDKVLFIIEAKGHRLTDKSKSGNKLRTEDHLKDMIRDSYNQGIRTLKCIEDNSSVEFKTKEGKVFTISKNDFDDVVIVSLTLEPIGNLSMEIKATNAIGYFKDGHFPWIISIYDLTVITDHIDNPFTLIHYLKRRKLFLNNPKLSIYEELDLFAYYLSNGLYFENTLKKGENNNIEHYHFSTNTDAMNDFYMHKFGHKTKKTLRPKLYVPDEYINFLNSLDASKIEHRVKIGLLLLEFNVEYMKKFTNMLNRNKRAFSNDKKLHDCSISTQNLEGLGFTLMNHINKDQLDKELYNYCNYKINQLKMNCWIGIGDTSTNSKEYNFQSVFFWQRKKSSLD